jgi:hypothetical protein
MHQQAVGHRKLAVISRFLMDASANMQTGVE